MVGQYIFYWRDELNFNEPHPLCTTNLHLRRGLPAALRDDHSHFLRPFQRDEMCRLFAERFKMVIKPIYKGNLIVSDEYLQFLSMSLFYVT